MLKKILLGVVAIGIVGVVYWSSAPSRKPMKQVASEPGVRSEVTTALNTAGDKVVNEAAKMGIVSGLPGGSIAAELSSEIMLLMSFGPREIDEGMQGIASFFQRLNNTAAWKKVNGASNLTEIVKKGFEEGWNKKQLNGSNPLTLSEMEIALADFLAHWRTVQRAELVISRKTFATGAKTPELPLMMLRVNSNDESAAKALFEKIKTLILKEGNSLDTPGVSVVASVDKPELRVTLRGPKPEDLVNAVLNQVGSSVHLLLGTDTPAAFIAAGAQATLSSLPAWKAVLDSRPERSTGFGFVDAPAFGTFFEGFLAKLSAENPDQAEKMKYMKHAFESYQQMQGVGFAWHMKDAMAVTACTIFLPESEILKGYVEAFKIRDAAKGASSFDRLLDSGSIFAARGSLASSMSSINALSKEIQDLVASSGGGLDDREVERAIGKVQSALSELAFQDIGFLVGPPIMPPIIGAGLFLGNSKLSGEPLLQAFVKNINELAAEFGIIAGGAKKPPLARLSKKPDGSSQVILVVGGLELVAGLAAESSIVLSIDDSMVKTFAQRFKSGQPFFAQFKSPEGLGSDIQQSDFYFYLHTDTLIGLLRNFLPMILATQQQQPKLEMAEAEEILNLLKVSWLHLQKSYSPAEKEVCYESKSVFLVPGE